MALPSPKRLPGSLLPAAVLAVLSAAVIRLSQDAVVTWDESYYVYFISRMAAAVRYADWTSLGALWNAQLEKGMGMSVVAGLLVSPFPLSVSLIRAVGVLWFVAAGAFLWRTALRMPRATVGTAAASLLVFVLSPMTLILSGVVMAEVPGTALSLAALSCLGMDIRPGYRRLAMASVVVLMLTLVKYQYGILLMGVLAAELVLRLMTSPRPRPGHAGAVSLAALVLPWAAGFALRILYPVNRISEVVAVVQNRFPVTDTMGTAADRLLYYPNALMHAYSLSPAAGVLLIATAAAALPVLGHPVLRPLWLLTVGMGVPAVLHTENLQERFFFIPFAGLAIMAPSVLSWWYARLRRIVPVPGRIWAVTAAAVIVITGQAAGGNPVAYVKAVGANAFKTPLYAEKGYRDRWFVWDLTPDAAATVMNGRPENVLTDIRSVTGTGTPVSWIGQSNELSPFFRQFLFDPRLFPTRPRPGGYASYAAVVTVLPSSPFYTLDYRRFNEPKQNDMWIVTADPSWERIASSTYADLGITSAVYGKR